MLHVDRSQFAADLAAATKARVYSYTRFSTPEQALGDSHRRQTDAAAKWASKRGLILDETLAIFDEGVSAFRGSNTGEDRGLGRFLFACRHGMVPTGSYFLVESLDRVSRMAPRRAQRLLDDIVDAGVTIVTLNDGQEYTADRLDNDPTALLIALMVAWRAHEESKTKARRLAEAWQEKRRKITAGETTKLTERAPGWLRWTPEGWSIIPERGDVVRRVFAMTLQGVGEHKIAQTLNLEAVPVFGRGKMWHRSAIAKLLRNPSVIGTLIPGRIEYVDGKRSRVTEQPVPNAFPHVISQDDWLTIRAMKDGETTAVRGRGAKAPLANVLSSLARCPDCGAAMTRVNKGRKGGKPKLVCTRAKVGAEKHYHAVCLDRVQQAVLTSWGSLMSSIPPGSRHADLDRDKRNAEASVSALEEHLGELEELLTQAPSQGTAKALRRTEQQLHTMREALRDIEEQQAGADGGLIHMRMSSLGDAMEPEEGEVSLPAVNAGLRALFSGVVVDHHSGHLAFQWKQGGVTEVIYQWPE
jgi:DNA invertase Pin-like site-specific DNA recombinase